MSVATLVQPTGEMWEKIRVELNENQNTKEQDLATIKEWLRKQPHLPDEFDDRCLMSFLRGTSYSLEKCKRKLDMYFTMRTACPEFFTDRDITRPELDNVMAKVQGAPLPGLTPNGRRVTICRGLDKDIKMDVLNNVFKLALMIGDVRLMEELEGVGGDIYVLDAGVVSPTHLAQLSPTAISKFLVCVQEAYPVKLKEIHIVNTSPLIEKLINIIKPFLKEKIKNRIFIHSEISSLYEHIPQKMLPEEYGGSGASLVEINNAWKDKLATYTTYFKDQESLKAVEELRPGKPTNYDELFGIDGSFRQLSID
ncbi:alpha-tocopherol transfer protein-like [Aricia agestis]|uniref:alpha-tocopherol transfer protein-like n=1 Tax=Aricia agestis TaxID=91739 RepID=UPI001C208005|nr:alpha-tocopherol transfer protein-like [Aricia agestis]